MCVFLNICSYNDISAFDELESRLPNDDVDDVHDVGNDVTDYPVFVGSFVVVGKGQPGGAEPNVVVVGHGHHSQPGDVSTI